MKCDQSTIIANTNRNIITTNCMEVMDLRELFVLLTYQCNGNCKFCIERKVHEKGFLSDENFDKALEFAKKKGLTTIFLHGGEPTVHPRIVEFARKAKKEGFLVKMFTNGIEKNLIKKLDGILDEIIISYHGKYTLEYLQKEWTSLFALQIIVTEAQFPTFLSLKDFVNEARKTGMQIRINTLNPVNQYSYDNQYVSYLEKIFMNLPDDKIVCASNKVMFEYEGIKVRMSNKSLNPGHIKYSMSPNGKIYDHFERNLNIITKNEKMERLLNESNEKLIRLRGRKNI